MREEIILNDSQGLNTARRIRREGRNKVEVKITISNYLNGRLNGWIYKSLSRGKNPRKLSPSSFK